MPEDKEQREEFIDTLFNSTNRVRNANNHLAERELIRTSIDTNEPNVIGVKLTVAGYDLGRKYASRWERTGLCFAEYKDHWISLVVSALIAIITSLIVSIILHQYSDEPDSTQVPEDREQTEEFIDAHFDSTNWDDIASNHLAERELIRTTKYDDEPSVIVVSPPARAFSA